MKYGDTRQALELTCRLASKCGVTGYELLCALRWASNLKPDKYDTLMEDFINTKLGEVPTVIEHRVGRGGTLVQEVWK